VVQRLTALVGQYGECGSSVGRIGVSADESFLFHAVGEPGEAARLGRTPGHQLRMTDSSRMTEGRERKNLWL
jgi:hypothetical protein